MQGVHLCSMAILVITAQLCVLCTSTRHHPAEHQLETALVTHCVQTHCLKRTGISKEDIPTGRERNED